MGLPAEKADQIFNAFFTTKAQGSGMGLAISRSIVESHGGRLWATANHGRGATFSFNLPIPTEAVQVAETRPGFDVSGAASLGYRSRAGRASRSQKVVALHHAQF